MRPVGRQDSSNQLNPETTLSVSGGKYRFVRWRRSASYFSTVRGRSGSSPGSSIDSPGHAVFMPRADVIVRGCLPTTLAHLRSSSPPFAAIGFTSTSGRPKEFLVATGRTSARPESPVNLHQPRPEGLKLGAMVGHDQ